nr:retrotransposon Gag domain-containing protein [Tanacetum cinerariifolium]
MSGLARNRNKNKFCEFHGDKGHNMDECIHLRKQIEEVVKFGQLSHLIKELKQISNKWEHAKAAKKGDTSGKEKVVRAPKELLPNQPVATEGIQVAIHPEYLKQTVTIGNSLSEKEGWNSVTCSKIT